MHTYIIYFIYYLIADAFLMLMWLMAMVVYRNFIKCPQRLRGIDLLKMGGICVLVGLSKMLMLLLYDYLETKFISSAYYEKCKKRGYFIPTRKNKEKELIGILSGDMDA